MPPEPPDHYRTLGIEPGASADEIKASYRRLSRELHPDRNAAADANRRMAAVNEAYRVLSDAARRAEHDRTLRRARPQATGASNPTVRNYAGSSGSPGTAFAAARAARAEAMRSRPIEYAKPPVTGRGAPQPERMPDWYAFLGVPRGTPPAEAIRAWRALQAHVRMAHYAPDDEANLLAQLRQAADTLTNPTIRAIYDDAIAGIPPPPGEYPYLHPHWYSFLGVRPKVSGERLAERVTELTSKLRRGSREYREVEEAWRTLRDPGKRADYDAAMGLG